MLLTEEQSELDEGAMLISQGHLVHPFLYRLPCLPDRAGDLDGLWHLGEYCAQLYADISRTSLAATLQE